MRIAALFLTALTLTGADIDPAAYQAHVNYLASDALKGRGTATPELEKAADYIESQFKSFGLKPVPGAKYRQEFEVRTGARLDRDNRMTVQQGKREDTLTLRQGFIPFSFSKSGSAKNLPVVFAGYGITAPEYNYDDYAGLDVKDKLVLILRHEPQENDAQSVFNGRGNTHHAEFANKATNAKNHGAAGVILINDTYSHPGERDALMAFGSAAGPENANVFYVQVTAETAEGWIKSAGHDLRQTIQAIDKDLKPASFAIPEVTVSLDVEIVREIKKTQNVVAYLPGKTKEYVIIGAHYDHLGLGNEFSLAPKEIGSVHHGADDNASGTAGVIELARYFSKQPQLDRGILFMTFSGEELGLLGSRHFVENPLLPLEDAVTMINMDMIGRAQVQDGKGKIFVNGAGTGSTLPGIVAETPLPSDLRIDLSESTGYGGSDHMSFTPKKVPVIFFFSGLHGDYHKPSDTADKIESAVAAHVVGYIGEIVTRIAQAPERPEFKTVTAPQPNPADPHSGGVQVSSGARPVFGSVPDYAEIPNGVRFSDVREGTPAAKAGLRAGDILIWFGGKEIANLYDFQYALQSHKPGDEVLVRVLRMGETIEAKVLLTN